MNIYLRPGQKKAAEEGWYLPVGDQGKAKPFAVDEIEERHASFKAMFFAVQQHRGRSQKQRQGDWTAYLKKNPRLERMYGQPKRH